MIGYKTDGRVDLVIDRINYLFRPVFEAGFFFFILFFFLIVALYFLPFEESRACAPDLALAFRWVAFVLVEAFVFEEALRVDLGPL